MRGSWSARQVPRTRFPHLEAPLSIEQLATVVSTPREHPSRVACAPPRRCRR
ncbi:hypothetical protein ACFOLD_08520 [Kocuria carniphila]|uniref:hypothetical protein n=1 Tax=Kocuria carniphila TaxID=262208 RepID=UPI003612BD42